MCIWFWSLLIIYLKKNTHFYISRIYIFIFFRYYFGTKGYQFRQSEIETFVIQHESSWQDPCNRQKNRKLLTHLTIVQSYEYYLSNTDEVNEVTHASYSKCTSIYEIMLYLYHIMSQCCTFNTGWATPHQIVILCYTWAQMGHKAVGCSR